MATKRTEKPGPKPLPKWAIKHLDNATAATKAILQTANDLNLASCQWRGHLETVAKRFGDAAVEAHLQAARDAVLRLAEIVNRVAPSYGATSSEDAWLRRQLSTLDADPLTGPGPADRDQDDNDD